MMSSCGDWHGVVLPDTVRARLTRVEQAMRACATNPSASPVRVLLWGPPGVGKTAIRNALARVTGMNVIATRVEDFRAGYLGQTQHSVAALFERARRQAPALISIDECDYFFPSRGTTRSDFTTDECIIALLVELEGRRTPGTVCIVGEAFDARHVDEAVLRRGFEVIEVPLPDAAARTEILRRVLREDGMVPTRDIDRAASDLAMHSEGSPGRDLVMMVKRRREQSAASGLVADHPAGREGT